MEQSIDMSSKVANEKKIEFSLNRGIYVDNNLFIPIPNEYIRVDYSFLSDYANSVVIVPKDHPQGTDPNEAELALIVQSQPIPCGAMYDPKKRDIYTELFTSYYPVFSGDEAIGILDITEGCGVLFQFFSGTDPVAWCKYHGIIFAKTNAYIFHLISNQRIEAADQSLNHTVFHSFAAKWLKRIILQEVNESKRFVDEKTNVAEVPSGENPEKHMRTEHKLCASETACRTNGKPGAKNRYLAWLSQHVPTSLWFEMQLAYETIERFSSKYHLHSESFFEITDSAIIQEIWNAIKTKNEFSKMGQNKRHTCELAVRYYETYLSELQAMDQSASDHQKQESFLEETRIRKQKEAEERKQREEELARHRKEEEERKQCEEELARRQRETAELRSRYYNLLQERQEQEQIVAQNRGWFGIQAKKRKAAQMRIREIDAQLALAFPKGVL